MNVRLNSMGTGRRLLLIRHCEDKRVRQDDPIALDRDCPLTDEGRAHANQMGRFLIQEGFKPDYAFVADCVRTKQTLQALGLALAQDRVEKSGALYSQEDIAAYVNILLRLKDLPHSERAHTVAIIGRKPQIPQFVRTLLGGDEEGYLPFNDHDYGYGMISCLQFTDLASWNDLYDPRTNKLAGFNLRVFARDPETGIIRDLTEDDPAAEPAYPYYDLAPA
ncbi:MAG: SixA phosphatase family protein [Alphaproteobacteria bacterium]